MFAQHKSSKGDRLIAYFYSGWAFFIPYLLAYLLYLWQKWPANSSAPSALGNSGHIPALLHVYWALHTIHLVLAIIALRSWWKAGPGRTSLAGLSAAVTSSKLDVLYTVAPWLFLALIFFIPGVYLEWPADPWEHLRRITEWSIHPFVGEHSAGYKSFYFFAYSFISVPPNLSRLGDTNIYGTCIDLLLAWQYYRLAKAVGLNPRWSFLFVLVNALTLGNVCFSFYKYYTLASTMYAQLGAVAMMRITIDFFQRAKTQDNSAFNWLRLSRPIAEYVICLTLLSTLVACNHIQGIGIAGLGIGSIIVWRLLDWKRSAIWWLIATAVILSIATILWWPRHPVIDTDYRPGRWLSAWYGFNLFAWPSPAADRTLQILGVFGLINLGAGIWLAIRNHVTGWLTAGPIAALALPFVALPLANSLGANNFENIVTFQRMFFAIPIGLPVICCISCRAKSFVQNEESAFRWSIINAMLVLAAVIALMPSRPWYNRLWDLIKTTSDDLQLKPIIYMGESTAFQSSEWDTTTLVANTISLDVLNIIDPHVSSHAYRFYGKATTDAIEQTIARIRASHPMTKCQQPSAVNDPFDAIPSKWISVLGSQPEFISEPNDFQSNSTVLQNPPGKVSYIFTRQLIPIDRESEYQVKLSARHRFGAPAPVYLAIAWYDKASNLLPSDQPSPRGAGLPNGWRNGAYSYFGLAGTSAPAAWTTYLKSFGSAESAAIPPNAKYFRIGALLNYNTMSSSGVSQITNVRLRKKSRNEAEVDGMYSNYGRLLIVVPSMKFMWTARSQSAEVSRHWPKNQVATDFVGRAEVITATRGLGELDFNFSNTVLEFHRVAVFSPYNE